MFCSIRLHFIWSSWILFSELERVAKEFCLIRRSFLRSILRSYILGSSTLRTSFRASCEGDHRWDTDIKDHQQLRVPFSFWIFPRSPAKKSFWRSFGLFSTYPTNPPIPLNESRIDPQMGVMQSVTFLARSLKKKTNSLVGRYMETYSCMMPRVELSSSYWSVESLPSLSANVSMSLKVACSLEL